MEHQNLDKVADAPSDNWVYRFLPQKLWPHAQLARWDRPIGWQLLLWPCLWSLLLAQYSVEMISWVDVGFFAILFFIGSVAMRGAGCTYNDLVDQDLDAKVERTRSRPLPAGRISRKAAKLFILIQIAMGALVLFQFNWFMVFLSMSSLLIVAVYPFAKRVTDWPQLVLGLAFSWGALVGWSAVFGSLNAVPFFLYLAAIFWTIGYDTIYAHQDKDDDALIGVRSTARLFADNTKIWLTALFSLTVLALCIAFYIGNATWPAYVGILIISALFIHQIKVLNIDDPDQCLVLFKRNTQIGFLVLIGLLSGLFI